jgi:hypothetical protein
MGSGAADLGGLVCAFHVWESGGGTDKLRGGLGTRLSQGGRGKPGITAEVTVFVNLCGRTQLIGSLWITGKSERPAR